METTPRKPSALKNLFSRTCSVDNPIITKELKTIDSSLTSNDPSFIQVMGKVIFSTVVLLELLMLGFIGPALTAGSIASEREHKTIDLLKTSLLSARSIVLGKLSSAAAFLLLLVFTAIPLQSLAFFLGGVGMAEIVVSTLMLVVTAIFFCALGLFFSSFARRTLIATVYSYSSILISFILFILLLFSISVLDSTYGSVPPTLLENIITIAAWILFSTNPFFAAIMSETILIDDQSLYTTTNAFFGNTSLILPSPWIIYLAFYILLTILLISLSVYFVKRPDR